MNRDFDEVNFSLSEELSEEAKILFQKFKGPK